MSFPGALKRRFGLSISTRGDEAGTDETEKAQRLDADPQSDG